MRNNEVFDKLLNTKTVIINKNINKKICRS